MQLPTFDLDWAVGIVYGTRQRLDVQQNSLDLKTGECQECGDKHDCVLGHHGEDWDTRTVPGWIMCPCCGMYKESVS